MSFPKGNRNTHIWTRKQTNKLGKMFFSLRPFVLWSRYFVFSPKITKSHNSRTLDGYLYLVPEHIHSGSHCWLFTQIFNLFLFPTSFSCGFHSQEDQLLSKHSHVFHWHWPSTNATFAVQKKHGPQFVEVNTISLDFYTKRWWNVQAMSTEKVLIIIISIMWRFFFNEPQIMYDLTKRIDFYRLVVKIKNINNDFL